MDRAETSRRLKAARQLGGFSKPAALAEHPVCKQNGITASLIRQTETMRRDARPMELAAIAEACDLPPEFFTMPLDRLSNVAIAARLAALERKLDALLDSR